MPGQVNGQHAESRQAAQGRWPDAGILADTVDEENWIRMKMAAPFKPQEVKCIRQGHASFQRNGL